MGRGMPVQHNLPGRVNTTHQINPLPFDEPRGSGFGNRIKKNSQKNNKRKHGLKYITSLIRDRFTRPVKYWGGTSLGKRVYVVSYLGMRVPIPPWPHAQHRGVGAATVRRRRPCAGRDKMVDKCRAAGETDGGGRGGGTRVVCLLVKAFLFAVTVTDFFSTVVRNRATKKKNSRFFERTILWNKN